MSAATCSPEPELSAFVATSDKPFYVFWIARENHRVLADSDRHHNGVNDIRGARLAEQVSSFVRLLLRSNGRLPHDRGADCAGKCLRDERRKSLAPYRGAVWENLS